LLGLLFAIAEFMLPTGGALGVMAMIALVAAAICGFLVSGSTGLMILLVQGVAIPSLLYAAIRIWPHTPMGRRMLLPVNLRSQDVLPDNEIYRRREMIGKIGLAKSAMLPSGAILIDGQIYDALAQGVPIDPGTPVRVVAVEGNQLIVRP